MTLLSGDRALLEQFRQGRADALTQVYTAYAPLIAAFLSRGFNFSSKGRNLRFAGYHQPFDLENALQETFVRAFSEQARLAYDGLTPYRSYLLAVARNWVLSEMRRREVAMSQLVSESADPLREGELGEDEPQPLGGSAPLSAEAELLNRELSELYQGFLAGLSPAEESFFHNRFEEKLTQVEAGQRDGLSHMQARTLEKKLRKRFLKYMQTRGYLEGYGKTAVAG